MRFSITAKLTLGFSVFAVVVIGAFFQTWGTLSRSREINQRINTIYAPSVKLLEELDNHLVKAQQLIKGYGDTHARGWRSFEKIIQALPLLQSQVDGSKRMAHLIQAALADEHGNALDKALFALNLHAQNPN